MHGSRCMPPPAVNGKRKLAVESNGKKGKNVEISKKLKGQAQAKPLNRNSGARKRQGEPSNAPSQTAADESSRRRQPVAIASSAGPIFQVQWDAAGIVLRTSMSATRRKIFFVSFLIPLVCHNWYCNSSHCPSLSWRLPYFTP